MMVRLTPEKNQRTSLPTGRVPSVILSVLPSGSQDYSDDELLKSFHQVIRLRPPRTLPTLMQAVYKAEYTYSFVEIGFENALERLGILMDELKHIEEVLQAILDDDMADFEWTSRDFPEHVSIPS